MHERMWRQPHQLRAIDGIVGWAGAELGLVLAPGLVPGPVSLHDPDRARRLRALEVKPARLQVQRNPKPVTAPLHRLCTICGLKVHDGALADIFWQVHLSDHQRAGANNAEHLGGSANDRIDVLDCNRRAPGLKWYRERRL